MANMHDLTCMPRAGFSEQLQVLTYKRLRHAGICVDYDRKCPRRGQCQPAASTPASPQEDVYFDVCLVLPPIETLYP